MNKYICLQQPRWVVLTVLFALQFSVFSFQPPFFNLQSSIFVSPAGAQSFTERLQRKGTATEGTITISHDSQIDQLVNASGTGGERGGGQRTPTGTPTATTSGRASGAQTSTAEESESAKARRQLAKILGQEPDTTATDAASPDGRRKVMRGGYKVDGYRVQAFAGGNQRKDRQKAEQVGSTIKHSFPDEPVYVHFYSPRWICRVGNYRTYEEAYQMLLNIRKLGISGASVVKGKITVQY